MVWVKWNLNPHPFKSEKGAAPKCRPKVKGHACGRALFAFRSAVGSAGGCGELAEDDFVAATLDAASGVARVDDQLGRVNDLGVVVAGVVGGNDDAIVTGDGLRVERHRLHVLVVIVAHLVKLREVGIVVVEFGAALLEQLHDLQRGRLAKVIDVFLVGDAEDEDFRALDGFLAIVESGCDGFDHVVRHRGVDFAGELDETCGEIVFARFPGKIEGVDRDAVTAEAGAGIERHEAERLGGRGVDDFPDVHAHAQAEHFELVDHRDIDAAEDVLEQLGHFGGSRRADWDNFGDDRGVERYRRAPARGIGAANDLRNLRQAVLFVAGIFALWREGEEEIAGDVFGVGSGSDGALEAALFENRQKELFGRAGIRGGFENDELTLLEVRVDREAGVLDVAQVGFAAFVERRRDADDDGVDIFELGEIGGGAEVLAVDVLLNLGLLNVLDVGLARIEHRDLFGIGIESCHFVTGFGETEAEGKADISAADDAYFELATFEKFGFTVAWHLSLRRAPKIVGGAARPKGRKNWDGSILAG